jgi:uncharacterized protein (TIGR04255 family)
MTHPHLQQAPITEAVLEVRCVVPDESLELLAEFEKRVQPDYTMKRERIQVHVNVADAEAISTKRVDGLLLQHESAPQIVQARFDGFAFSRLRPYGRWNELREEAVRLWAIYRDVFKPTKVVRLGLRYINAIEINVKEDPSKTLRILPMLPSPVAPTGNNSFTSFTLQVSTEYPDFGAAGNLLEHWPLVPPEAETAHVVLDIDVYKPLEFDTDDAAIWVQLEQLRELKNFIFFSSVTPEAVRRFA